MLYPLGFFLSFYCFISLSFCKTLWTAIYIEIIILILIILNKVSKTDTVWLNISLEYLLFIWFKVEFKYGHKKTWIETLNLKITSKIWHFRNTPMKCFHVSEVKSEDGITGEKTRYLSINTDDTQVCAPAEQSFPYLCMILLDTD